MQQAKRKFPHDRPGNGDRRSGMIGSKKNQRRYPIGAELIGAGRTHFRVWAPKADRLEVVLEGKWGKSRGAHSTSSGQAPAPPTFEELERDPAGYFSGSIEASAGTLYRFRIDG